MQSINEKLLDENKILRNKLNKGIININNKNEINKNKGTNNKLKTFYRSKSKMDIIVNKSFNLNRSINSSSKTKSKFNISYGNQISESKHEKDKNSSLNEDSDNSFPKLEEYNIDNDEEEKINKIKNIGKIKIYSERKKLFENYNTCNNNQNNFLITIKDSSIKKENSYKNNHQNDNLDSNKIIHEKESFYNNKYDSKDESSND